MGSLLEAVGFIVDSGYQMIDCDWHKMPGRPLSLDDVFN